MVVVEFSVTGVVRATALPYATSYVAVLTVVHGRPFAELLAALDVGIAGGAEDRVTGTVEQLTGRPPRPLREFLLPS